MTRKLAKSLQAAERKALAGENESQDSQIRLLHLMEVHGVGVTSSSPCGSSPPPERPTKSLAKAAAATTLHTYHTFHKLRKQADEADHLETSTPQNTVDDASGRISKTGVANDQDDIAIAIHSSLRRINQHPSGAPASSSSGKAAERPQTNQCNANSSNEPSYPLAEDNSSTAPVKPKIGKMSTQSPTQSNEDRSYEQYNDRGSSQALDTQYSNAEEHRTLHEGDTGYVSLNLRNSLDSPDCPDTPFTHDHDQDNDDDDDDDDDQGRDDHGPSQLTSQPTLADTAPFAPETPAVFPKPFFGGGAGQVLGGSQLFAQTQPTSGLKKPSPTSSRPSPNIFQNNMTSPSRPTSSPLKDRSVDMTPFGAFASTSPVSNHHSSGAANHVPPFSDLIEGSDPDEDDNENDVDITPHVQSRSVRNTSSLEPINEYRPYQKLRSTMNPPRSRNPYRLSSDTEQDEAEDRYQRAKLKRARASKSFPDIGVPAASSEKANIEVPSTNRAKRPYKRTVSDEYIEQCHGKYVTDNDSTQEETVADSQDAIISKQQLPTDDASAPLPQTVPEPTRIEQHASSEETPVNTDDKDLIPETSPAGTSVDPPNPNNDLQRLSSGVPSTLPKLSLPDGPIETPKSTAPELGIPEDPGTGTSISTLTVLSNTPMASSSTTPQTENEDGDEHEKSSIVAVSSPIVSKRKRLERPTSSMPDPFLSVSGKKASSRSWDSFGRGRRQSSRHSSASLDDLVSSPSVSGTSRAPNRKVARKSTLREFQQAKGGVFSGMTFAISLHAQQSQRSKHKSPILVAELQKMIKQEGGHVLQDGFDPLFTYDTFTNSNSMVSGSLQPADADTGFVALIADQHSRKVKYMQALALGIPCLAPQWIKACIAKGDVVSWSSYLLCAGSSALLGDAIRSRNLQPYNASTARLQDVVNERPKLLDGSKVLLVMKKATEQRLPYVFLTQALGASLERVHTLGEARTTLCQAELESEEFDWVYVEGNPQTAGKELFGSGKGEGSSKRRKRLSTSTATDADDERIPKRIRILNDELVIQSLINGRLIEDMELEEMG
ncbi:hypothetical protein F5Y18DRAFT_270238 [Xylariaceae sp. FL1019]|nr:hypothetical protein F5Y18DRAFT_270238 [Xylariaceae sp. FL1019]